MPFCPYCGEEMLKGHAFCRKCGKKIGEEPVADARVEPPTPAATEPAPAPTPVPPLKAGFRVTRKILVLVLVIGLGVAFVGFAVGVKCIPVVKDYTVKEEYKYTYKTWENEWKSTNEVVFEKDVTLSGFKAGTSDWYYETTTFSLGKHWQIKFDVVAQGYAGASLYVKEPERAIASRSGTFVTPQSGDYYVYFSNLFGTTPARVSVKITVTAKLEVVERTNTGTATLQITRYEVTYLTIFEWLTRRSSV